ncbi:MAG TPA: class I SAM-dependent methyltransferase [Thermomicrobiaceae bacterium]|nr:class I SAM-dependent methyltransferase [Thermomicrobiaceae bacterium]
MLEKGSGQMDEAGRWAESDSRNFIDIGDAVTPSRHEHLELLAALWPARPDEAFEAVDLACGVGSLSAALLERFPACRVIGLDGSSAMLEAAGQRLARFGNRVELHAFDLFDDAWLTSIPERVRGFVSSLAIHHLDGAQKRQLFQQLAARLEPGGALLVLDLVEPINRWAWAAYAAAWDAVVRQQTADLPDGAALYARFRAEWNHYADPDEEFDKPSPLFAQLGWLEQAGLAAVDCFWLRAGHALYGGYAPGAL